MNRIRRIVTTISLLAATIAGGLVVNVHAASASGDFGDDTCIEGYVWREAVDIDHVCVTPAERYQVAQDNAAAASRVDVSSGTDYCIQGYVWREATKGNRFASTITPADHVCVTPAERDQVAYDNTQWDVRMLFMMLTWDEGNTPTILLQGYGFNTGWVYVSFNRVADDSVIWAGWAYASPVAYGGLSGFSVQTPVPNCAGGIEDTYTVAVDYTSGRSEQSDDPFSTSC